MGYRSMAQAQNVREQLILLSRVDVPITTTPRSNRDYYYNIRRALVAGNFMQVAYIESKGTYLTVKDNQVVAIHPSSVLDHKPKWITYAEFVLTSKNYVRTVTAIECDWLLQLAPHYYDLESFPRTEAKFELESAMKRIIRKEN